MYLARLVNHGHIRIVKYYIVGNLDVMTTTGEIVTSYVYDANRLTSVSGVAYAWDDNGNLLNDSVYTYTYDTANRLTVVSDPSSVVSFAYNGLGDRLGQTMDGLTTSYTVDMAGGLTQVLSDGTDSYLYGVGRIGEEQPDGWLYHHGDALGSVRQLTDETGEVKLARNYEPYGDNLSTAGNVSSVYQFTGEMRDATGLTFLRARYLDSDIGRFITKDVRPGDYYRPLSLNSWNYAESNPVRWVDRTGFSPQVNCEDMPFYLDLRKLCELGNGDDNDPIVLDAREEIFRIFVLGGKIYGYKDEGYKWASKTLEHFLDGNGSQ